MNIRARKQLEAAKKKGRVSADIFEVDNKVIIQDVSTKKWNKVGKIIEKREADDGQDISFVILMANGRETIRHRSHIRHNVTRYTKVIDKKSHSMRKRRKRQRHKGRQKKEKERETKKRGV